MSIKQILPANGWVAAHWDPRFEEKSGTHSKEQGRYEQVTVVLSEPVTLWALYEDGQVHGLVNYTPILPPSDRNKADDPTLLPANQALENFLGYASSEEEAKEVYQGAAMQAHRYREGR